MTLDQAIRDAVRQEMQHLHTSQAPAPAVASYPLDSDQLQQRGYSKHEAYALLRAHGVRLPGGRRVRIALEILLEIEAGKIDPPAISRATKKQGRTRHAPQGS